MPKRKDINKVLVIGSGPIVIGQAAEFDYAGTQACRALKEEGVSAVLVNSNPATIMTDAQMADAVYIEPLDIPTIQKIIEIEKPDCLLPTLGGQIGLNLATELSESGYLEKMGVELLGTPVSAIRESEDRELFKQAMESIDVPTIESTIVNEVGQAKEFAEKVGLPLVVRPAYTMGGAGGGIAHTMQELEDITSDGLRESRVTQCLIEVCIAGYKEIEYEVMADDAGTCVAICSMENVDPVGIHTGDSIVVAPAMTLTDAEESLLRSKAKQIIRRLGICGGCNVQFAMKPDGSDYYIIEVNPRLSRSSALASKATGYPIAKVSTRIALGYRLDEIKSDLADGSFASSEPAVDYVVAKFPRWPFDKFVDADRTLGTRMKATGESMSFGANFEQAILKGIRSLENNVYSLHHPTSAGLDDTQLLLAVRRNDDLRLFHIAEAIRRDIPVEKINEMTGMDLWFLNRFKGIIDLEKELAEAPFDKDLLVQAKNMGLPDVRIAELWNADETRVREVRHEQDILPKYRRVDTCGGAYPSNSPYLYSIYGPGADKEVAKTDRETVVVIGSGPIRIGQGIEFDYCNVHCVRALQEQGMRTVIINSNPETVSTDFDIADTLYFEPLTPEDVLEILDRERPAMVVVQFGGQTALKLAQTIHNAGFRLFGTSLRDIDNAEDRKEFDAIVERARVPRPDGRGVISDYEAIEVAERVGYPVLVRPSYVLGGQGMEIAHNPDELNEYMHAIQDQPGGRDYPVLIDKYIEGREIEVDAVCDGEEVLIPGIIEHIERAGVHSGDSMSVYPSQNLSPSVIERVEEYTRTLSQMLNVKGMINIQYIVSENEKSVYVIEVNPRASRTVPYISKVTGIPIVDLAVRVGMGEMLRDMEYGTGICKESPMIAVKVPVFSFEKLPNVDTSLGPEMKSTGEVMGVDSDYATALLKGIVGSGITMPAPDGGEVLLTVADGDKAELLPIAEMLVGMGYRLHATEGTAHFLNKSYLGCNSVGRLDDKGKKTVEDLIKSGHISLVINTPTKGHRSARQGFKIRRMAIERHIPCLTSLDTARELVTTIKTCKGKNMRPVKINGFGKEES